MAVLEVRNEGKAAELSAQISTVLPVECAAWLASALSTPFMSSVNSSQHSNSKVTGYAVKHRFGPLLLFSRCFKSSKFYGHVISSLLYLLHH